MRILCLFLLGVLSFSSRAQGVLQGQVVDGEKGQGLPGVSVFVNNTTIGTATDSEGRFLLSLPSGPQELILSYVGYQTARLSVTAGGALCTIRNPEVLRFRNDKSGNSLVVWAAEPLIIENKALGYELQYSLEEFTYSFRDRVLLYQGYPFFREMKGGAAQQRRWQERRHKAYEGSMMHFMRAVYRNRLTEEGFEVKRMERRVNEEKARYDILYNWTVTGDSIAYGMDATTAGLEFTHHLQVTYLRADAPDEFIKSSGKWAEHPVSRIYLQHGRPVAISADGSYREPLDLMTEGYWSWAEKVANLLPFDFKAK